MTTIATSTAQQLKAGDAAAGRNKPRANGEPSTDFAALIGDSQPTAKPDQPEDKTRPLARSAPDHLLPPSVETAESQAELGWDDRDQNAPAHSPYSAVTIESALVGVPAPPQEKTVKAAVPIMRLGAQTAVAPAVPSVDADQRSIVSPDNVEGPPKEQQATRVQSSVFSGNVFAGGRLSAGAGTSQPAVAQPRHTSAALPSRTSESATQDATSSKQANAAAGVAQASNLRQPTQPIQPDAAGSVSERTRHSQALAVATPSRSADGILTASKTPSAGPILAAPVKPSVTRMANVLPAPKADSAQATTAELSNATVRRRETHFAPVRTAPLQAQKQDELPAAQGLAKITSSEPNASQDWLTTINGAPSGVPKPTTLASHVSRLLDAPMPSATRADQTISLPTPQTSTVLKSLTIELRPAELGIIQLTVQKLDDELRIVLKASSGQTASVLQQDEAVLKSTLAATGFRVSDLRIEILPQPAQAETETMPNGTATGSEGDTPTFGKHAESRRVHHQDSDEIAEVAADALKAPEPSSLTGTINKRIVI